MTVYNVNLGIGWASSGVEFAQKYRADIFRKINVPAKFIFSDLILADNIEALTKNIGFEDNEIIWLYNFFTDIKIHPSTYTLDQLEKDLDLENRNVTSQKTVNDQEIYSLNEGDLRIVARFSDSEKKTIDQVTYLKNNNLLMRDFYSYTKYAREYYSGGESIDVTFREFYNEDGSVAYVQHLNDNNEIFEFSDHRIFYSKNELYAEMLKELNFQKDDMIIIDRLDERKNLNNGQLLFENHGLAKIIIAIHADHYSEEFTNDDNVLWNNYYEYQFTHSEDVAAYVVATPRQQKILRKQLKKYFNVEANVICIPVGNLPKLIHPLNKRKTYSLITASRLASEKHLDWLVRAVIDAKQQVPELSLDIYGKGTEQNQLQEIINDANAQDYIRLMGQYDLTNIYCNYSAYIAASTSEGFGLSLMEAVGSGLPMIGFDVPYGNPTFIDDGKNGYLLPYKKEWSETKKYQELTKAIIKLFTESDLEEFTKHSYKVASQYLIDNVAETWRKELIRLNA